MNLNFSTLMFLLIVIIPFFLLKSENTKTSKLEFLESGYDISDKDSINVKLFKIIDGKEVMFLPMIDFNFGTKAFLKNDTIDFDLNLGLLGGYNLTVQIVDNNFKSKLTDYQCHWQEDLKIKNQFLKIERVGFIKREKIKGEIYCEAYYNLTSYRTEIERVRIRGYFELDLVDLDKFEM